MVARASQSRAATRPPRRAAFTLVELLVVIAIIAVLVGILIPVVGRVRESAHAANTQAQLTSLAAAIQAYKADFSDSAPGPLHNLQIYTILGGGAAPVIVPAPGSAPLGATQLQRITMSENLVLGLAGGLRNVAGEIQYDTAWVGTGPGSLGVTPKKLPAYIDTAEMRIGGTPLIGDYVDNNGTSGNDSIVPEISDRFPEAMPILYLRARAGSRTTGTAAANNPVVTDGTNPARPGQYDLSQIAAYVTETGGSSIGVGRRGNPKDFVPTSNYTDASGKKTNIKHGLRTVDPAKTLTPLLPVGTPDPNYMYPFDLHPALRQSLGTAPGITPVPKQKDAYILISAGIDRVYGTRDDITNFGNY